MSRLRDESGSALITALLAAVMMLALGLALLSIVDTQASQSATERTRDRGFNLAEGVLNAEAFVLGRSWPASAGASDCSLATSGFSDSLGATTAAGAATTRLRALLNSSYTDTAYAGATWQVNVCDDSSASTVWSNGLLTNPDWDSNANNEVWVRAQATVGTKTRAVAGLVKVRTTPALDAKYGLAAGGITDDLGTTVNSLGSNALGGVLSGLLGTTPTVAVDPNVAASTSSGVIGLRCGAADINLIPASTCLAGTIGALGALPVVSTLLTGGKLEQFPTTTAATADSIDQLRTQAVGSLTYYTSSVGASSSAAAPPCTFTTNTGTRSVSSVVFIEQVGTGDQFCYIDVSSGVQWKALVIGSGRVILRGNGSSTGTPSSTVTGPQTNTFSGVLYALNLQRASLGDGASPGREVVRIESGAHVRGGVEADGKSAKVGIYPPGMTLDTDALVCALVSCPSLLATTLKALGVTDLVDALVNGGCLVSIGSVCVVKLSALPVASVVTGILGQLQPKRAAYGSAIVSDVAAVDKVTVFGTSGVTAGSFRDMQTQ